jgi:5'-methylthioadenosine phosphorylase
MSSFDVLIITPEAWAASGDLETLETPYGTTAARLGTLGAWRAAWVDTSTSPFAAIYAAKAAGASRVVELAPVAARNRLLEIGDLLLPSDLVDRTYLPRYTFFAGKGYGFLAQREPFCPVLRGALLDASRSRSPRVFARGVYLVSDRAAAADPDVLWDADITGNSGVPTSFLARELELCYTPLCVVASLTPGPSHTAVGEGPGVRARLAEVLTDALERLPAERACLCAGAMQAYRERGDIGDDWRAWVAV